MENLSSLYDWWFNTENQKYWFNSNEENDRIIFEKFNILNGNIQKPNLVLTGSSSYEHSDSYNLIKKEAIGFVLFHDQIIRHLVRHQINAKILDILDVSIGPEKIFQTHFSLIENFIMEFYSLYSDLISGYDFCFTLLPLRHTQNYFKIKFVIKETWNKLDKLREIDIEQKEDLTRIYTKYLTASYQRAKYKLVNEHRYLTSSINFHRDIEHYVEKYSLILDEKSTYTFNDSYLHYDKIRCNIFQECSKIPKSSNLIISISGGVDSMVLSWVLTKLAYNIIFVHINYANRENTDMEQEMVQNWAKYLGKRFFYRKLDEINRPKCMEYDMRNIYETYTRDQRYTAYVQASKIMDWDEYYVVLGHNHDDCIENVFTNIASKTKWENLYGMEFESRICFGEENINFIRPLLNITKKMIYNFASENNILFLWDSTPKWSQRGKIRDLVKPSLIEFNPNILQGLDELVKILRQSTECIDELVEIFLSKISTNEDSLILNIQIKELSEKKIFWEKLFLKLKIKNSSKSLDNYIQKIISIKKKFTSWDYNSKERYQLNKEKQIIFFKNKSNELVIIF